MSDEKPGVSINGLSSEAQHILMLAYDEAAAAGSSVTEPEHILIALVLRGFDVDAAFGGIEINVVALRRALRATTLMRPDPVRHKVLSDAASDLLNRAAPMAGTFPIQPQHMLVALLEQRRPGVAAMLKEAGTTPEQLMRRLMGIAEDSKIGLFNLNPQARRALALAEAEAILNGHDHIEPEHVLIAIVYGGVANTPFQELRLSASALRSTLQQLMPPTTVARLPLALSEHTKQFLRLCLKIMRERSGYLVNPAHMVMALLEQSRPGVLTMLAKAGTTPDAIKAFPFYVDKAEPQTPPPANKMEHFTQRARLVMKLAQDEAQANGHHRIEPEHFLIAMVVEEGGAAGKVLREAGVTVEALKSVLLEMNLETAPPNPQMELSDGTKRCLELSVAEARKWSHNVIDTEHLLAGLMRQSKPGVVDMLTKSGTSPANIISQIYLLLSRSEE